MAGADASVDAFPCHVCRNANPRASRVSSVETRESRRKGRTCRSPRTRVGRVAYPRLRRRSGIGGGGMLQAVQVLLTEQFSAAAAASEPSARVTEFNYALLRFAGSFWLSGRLRAVHRAPSTLLAWGGSDARAVKFPSTLLEAEAHCGAIQLISCIPGGTQTPPVISIKLARPGWRRGPALVALKGVPFAAPPRGRVCRDVRSLVCRGSV